MSHVLTWFEVCCRCHRKYSLEDFKKLPTVPVKDAKREWPSCNADLGDGKICGSTDFQTKDNSIETDE